MLLPLLLCTEKKKSAELFVSLLIYDFSFSFCNSSPSSVIAVCASCRAPGALSGRWDGPCWAPRPLPLCDISAGCQAFPGLAGNGGKGESGSGSLRGAAGAGAQDRVLPRAGLGTWGHPSQWWLQPELPSSLCPSSFHPSCPHLPRPLRFQSAYPTYNRFVF